MSPVAFSSGKARSTLNVNACISPHHSLVEFSATWLGSSIAHRLVWVRDLHPHCLLPWAVTFKWDVRPECHIPGTNVHLTVGCVRNSEFNGCWNLMAIGNVSLAWFWPRASSTELRGSEQSDLSVESYISAGTTLGSSMSWGMTY